MSTWESRLRAVRRRLLLRGAAEEGTRVAAVTAALWAAGTLAFRLLTGSPPPLAWPWALAVSLLAASSALLVRLRRQFRLSMAAEASDRFLQSHDLMVTAVWLRSQHPLPPSGDVVLRRADTAAAHLQASRAAGRPARQVVVPWLMALITTATLAIWASVVPLPLLPAAAPPPQGMPSIPPGMMPSDKNPSEEEKRESGLSDSLQRLEQELAEGEASPQSTREALDRLLRRLEPVEPGSGPRSPLSPAEQEELEALLERVIGRAGPASDLEGGGEPQEGQDGERAPAKGRGRSSGGSEPGGPEAPALDPGATPERRGNGADHPSDSPDGPSQPGDGPGSDSQGVGPGGDGAQDGVEPDESLPGTGSTPGLDTGDPAGGPGYLPPPATTTGERELLPSTPETGPYGLGEGPRVTPSPAEDPEDRVVGGAGLTPGTDSGETPVLQPLLPALYQKWLQRYFTPGPS